VEGRGLTAETKPLEGRVALVTGAGRGIGKAIAARLSADGAAVVINDLDEAFASEASAEIPNSAIAVGSVADSAHTDEMVAVAEREFGTLDIVVNNAGLTKDALLHRMDDATWDLVVDVALKGTFYTCRSAARLLRRKDAGFNRKVVNISSINGIYGVAFNTNYSAAKAGIIGLTKALAREWAPTGINVNAVAPGFVETRLTAARKEGDAFGIPPEALEQIYKQIPIGRPGRPEDVAGLVAWLSTSDSDYVTGQVVEIHGGLEIVRVG
jgi:3-oxoacyl-[acyl-carrier protein] reductase